MSTLLLLLNTLACLLVAGFLLDRSMIHARRTIMSPYMRKKGDRRAVLETLAACLFLAGVALNLIP